MSGSSCCFLTCIHISQEAGQVVWYSHLFKNFPQFVVIHTVKGFGIVNKAEVDALQWFCSPRKENLSLFPLFPHLLAMKWRDWVPWSIFWMLSFKPGFYLLSHALKRLFSSSSLFAIRVVSSAYLRLLISLPASLTTACESSSLSFHVMCSVYMLNKQGDNIQLVLLSQFWTSQFFHVRF